MRTMIDQFHPFPPECNTVGNSAVSGRVVEGDTLAGMSAATLLSGSPVRLLVTSTEPDSTLDTTLLEKRLAEERRLTNRRWMKLGLIASAFLVVRQDARGINLDIIFVKDKKNPIKTVFFCRWEQF